MNVVVTRHADADRILADGVRDGAIRLEELTVEDAARSQAGNFRHRRDGLRVRLADDLAAGLSVPRKRVDAGYEGISTNASRSSGSAVRCPSSRSLPSRKRGRAVGSPRTPGRCARRSPGTAEWSPPGRACPPGRGRPPIPPQARIGAMADRRVGIVTINDDTNYGNRLQNFALQEVIRSLGWEPETLVNRPPAWDRALLAPRDRARRPTRLRRTRSAGRGPNPGRVGRESPQAPSFLAQRRAAIGGFARAHIDSSPHRFSEMPAELLGRSLRLRSRRIGSGVEPDVSTSAGHRLPGLPRRTTPDRLCRELRRRAGAGVPSFPVPRVASCIPHLSVRESTGRRIVADLTGRDVPVVLDPTLLVERAVWDRLTAERERDHRRALRGSLLPRAGRRRRRTHG